MTEGGAAVSDRGSAWSEYLGSAHRLDAVRQQAAATAAAEAEAVVAARAELPVVQARLGMQAARMQDAALQAGVQSLVLVPNAAEQRSAEMAVAGGPKVVVAALRQARSTVEVADAALARIDDVEPGQAVQNLVAYGPAAAVTTVIQLVFALLVDERSRVFYAAACGLTMGAMLFGMAWLLLGVIYPGRPKTPEIGALVCTAPVVLVAFLFMVL
ncbi:hypothetical protein Rhe02_64040 [Rhizocola hellebori]|uniref:Uncharacterized protein n=1 Tax=Rhizocola hellebori TaxID=1392758 RepID=A0A8J3VJD8_9ACTN|nr:hypothetical protein [Rhizocola hellebori]GIH08337.1 hypothetical protein Rhe02_64040 [Rhizocola hellebori]